MSRSERDPFLSESIRFLSFRLLCLSSDEEPIFVANTPIMVVVSRCARNRWPICLTLAARWIESAAFRLKRVGKVKRFKVINA